MKVFLHPELWIEYFTSRSKLTQSEGQQLLNQLIVNPNNHILYNFNWQEALDKVFTQVDSDEFNFVDLFSNALVELYDNDRLMTEVTPIAIREIEELLKYLLEGVVTETIFVKEKPKSIDSNDFAVFDQVEKLNKNWISFSLASECGKDGTRVVPRDFNSDEEISMFYFNLLNQRWLNKKRILVRTDYLHFGPTFEKIKNKKITVFTTNLLPNKSNKSTSQKDAERIKTRAELNKAVSIKYCSNRSELHQRTILSENLIIRQDHDYQEVNSSNNNWFITFFYSEIEYEQAFIVLDKIYS